MHFKSTVNKWGKAVCFLQQLLWEWFKFPVWAPLASMRFFKVQGKRSTFPWAIVCVVGIERDGWEEASPKSQGPDLECRTQIDMHKRKEGLNFQCSKEVSYVFKNISVCTSFDYWLFVFIRHRMQGSFETESTRTGFSTKQAILSGYLLGPL